MTLRDYLQQEGLTQAQFAAKIGVRQGTVSYYVRGRVPSTEVLSAIVRETEGQVRWEDFVDAGTVK